MLKKILVGRLVFTPMSDGVRRFYEFKGESPIGRILAGLVGAQALVSPNGATRFSTVDFQRVMRVAS